MTTIATAPGKTILFGEHAVVYGRPAIATPVSQIRAKAVIQPQTTGTVQLIAPDLNIDTLITRLAADDPLLVAIQQVQQLASLDALPPMQIVVSSEIPMASGLGSGAAVAAALIRALAQHLALSVNNETIAALTYEVEKIHHGTPSGIDNTVVAFEQPVYFVRYPTGNQIETFSVAKPLRLLIADTGVRSHTRVAVGDVRHHWQKDKDRFEALFEECGRIAQAARAAIEAGDITHIGHLMTENQALLVEMTVSSPELDSLVQAAQAAGALGAKLSGAGRGGNMIALVTADTETAVYQALYAAGAKTVLSSIVA